MDAPVYPEIRNSVGGVTVTSDSTQSDNSTASDPAAAKTDTTVERFDFVRPPQLSKEQRTSLDAVYSHFAQSLQELLSSLIRTPVDISVKRIEHEAFDQFRGSLASPCATFVFDTGCGAGGEGIIEIGPPVAYYVVDRLFGGPGEAANQERPLSDLERSVVRGVTERVLALLSDTWREHLELTPEIVRYESNPGSLRSDGRVQTVLVAELEMRVGDAFDGIISVCLPFLILEPFLRQQTGEQTVSRKVTKEGQNRHRARIENDLKLAQLFLSARLSPLTLSTRSLVNLKPGQVIQTTQHIELPIELHVNGQCRYRGTLGQVRRHVGLQITEKLSVTPGNGAVRTTRGRVL